MKLCTISNRCHFFLLSLFLILFVLLCIVSDTGARNPELNKKRKAVEASLKKAMSIPDSENAWMDYIGASDTYYKRLRAKKEDKKFSEMWSSLSKVTIPDTEIKKQMEANKDVLEQVARGYTKEKFQMRWDYKGNSLAPNLLGLLALNRLLINAAGYNARQKKYMDAARLYMEGLYAGTGMCGNTDGLGYGGGHNINEKILSSLRPFFINSEVPAEVYKYVITEMERLRHYESPFQTELDCDLVSSYYILEGLRAGALPEKSFDTKITKRPKKVYDEDEKILARLFLEYSNATAKKYPLAIKELEDIRKNCPPFTSLGDHIDELMLRYSYYSYARDQVNYGGTMILAALRLYRTQTGHYPNDLHSLAPDFLKEIPADYYAEDGAYIYRKEGEKIQLYSVGIDLKDYKAKIVSEDYYKPGDVVFINELK